MVVERACFTPISSSRGPGLASSCWATVHYSSNYCGLGKALFTIARCGSRWSWGRKVGWAPLETHGHGHREGSFLKANWSALPEQEKRLPGRRATQMSTAYTAWCWSVDTSASHSDHDHLRGNSHLVLFSVSGHDRALAIYIKLR